MPAQSNEGGVRNLREAPAGERAGGGSTAERVPDGAGLAVGEEAVGEVEREESIVDGAGEDADAAGVGGGQDGEIAKVSLMAPATARGRK